MASFGGFAVKVAFGFKSQETEEIELFFQGTNDSINLRYERLITIGYKCKEIPVLPFGCKLHRSGAIFANFIVFESTVLLMWNDKVQQMHIAI